MASSFNSGVDRSLVVDHVIDAQCVEFEGYRGTLKSPTLKHKYKEFLDEIWNDPKYNGIKPINNDVQEKNQWEPVDAPFRNRRNKRSPINYLKVVNQFAVEDNRRYEGGGKTYCNIFVWDVTRAMGVEIPHYIYEKSGKIFNIKSRAEFLKKYFRVIIQYNEEDEFTLYKTYTKKTGWEKFRNELNSLKKIRHNEKINKKKKLRNLENENIIEEISEILANNIFDLLNKGIIKGWVKREPWIAQSIYANRGKPAIAIWKNLKGPHGHISMIIPGEISRKGDLPKGGATIATAGYKNYRITKIAKSFNDSKLKKKIQYWTSY